MRLTLRIAVFVIVSATLLFSQSSTQQFADLGTCKLENNQTIQNCRIGYRTFGTLNATRSNAVLVTTWFLGNSEQASGAYVGADSLIDPAKYFIIVVDALGDGVS